MKDTDVKIQFKKRDTKIYEIWTDDTNGGDYLCNITQDDIGWLCYEVERDKEILKLSPKDFICFVWALCWFRIFNNCVDFDYGSDNYVAFRDWFNKEVIAWYSEVIQGLI